MYKILIADDQKSLRDMIRFILQDAGLPDVKEVPDGEEALAELQQSSFDLLISDWNMPRLDGIGLLKAVRAAPALKSLPVIMLTGASSREHVVEAVKLGVSGFVKKPFDPDVLLAAVRRAIPEPKANA